MESPSSFDKKSQCSSLRVFTFIWNTQSIRISESLDPDEIAENREGYLASYRFKADIPDFFDPLMKKIIDSDADLVVIGFQEDASPGSYFHSHILKNQMPRYNYTLIKRTKLMGVGATTYQALLSFDFKMRGLRISIYAKDAFAQKILEEEDILINDIGNTQKEYVCGSIIARNKGGTASYVRIPRLGTIAFLNAHLPFNSHSLFESAVRHDPMIRQTDVQNQNICFNEIYRKLILDLKVKPDYVIYMGDFNYRNKPGNIGAYKLASALQDHGCEKLYRELYLNCDELYDEMHKKKNIYEFNEGIDNQGPMFLPTGKMSKTRIDGYDVIVNSGEIDLSQPYTPNPNNTDGLFYKTGVADQRSPSWCDRILYKTLNDTVEPIKCISYERFDCGQTMKKSDHSGVIGVFTI